MENGKREFPFPTQTSTKCIYDNSRLEFLDSVKL